MIVLLSTTRGIKYALSFYNFSHSALNLTILTKKLVNNLQLQLKNELQIGNKINNFSYNIIQPNSVVLFKGTKIFPSNPNFGYYCNV